MVENEGEFKRRFIGCRQEYQKRVGKIPTPEELDYFFNRIVEDAKKEFPHELLLILKNITNAKQGNYIMHYEETMDLLNWFKKWFGSEEG